MLIDANQLVGWVVSPLLAAIVGGLVVCVKGVVKRENDHDKAMEQGMRALLRQQLIDYHRDYVVSGHACPVRVKEQATACTPPTTTSEATEREQSCTRKS